MKKLLLILTFSFLIFNLVSAEERDFGLQLNTGFATGLRQSNNLQLSLITDFFFFTDNLRMRFGPIFILDQDHYPAASIHLIGVNYQLPINQEYTVFAGIDYFKSYVHAPGLFLSSGEKKFKISTGLKQRLDRLTDLVTTLEILPQPFSGSSSETTIILSLGLEWYF